jgi:hypothetical protein
MNKVEERRRQMLALVDEWRGSGQSQKAFATARNIKLFTFRYWIQKHGKAEKQEHVNHSFVQLRPVSVPGIIIRYAGGTSLELPANTPLHVVRQLINL